MNTRCIVVPKKYNYSNKLLSLNEGVNFLQEQINRFNDFNLDLLIKYKAFFKKNEKLKNDANTLIVINDITTFLIEYNAAKEQLFKCFNRVSKGAYGEDKTRDIISTFEGQWKVLRNANFSFEGNRIENDFVIVDESGITTIEVKNVGNHYDTLYVDKLGRAYITKGKFGGKTNFPVIEQSNRHLGYLIKLIKKNFNFDIPVQSIIVMSSDIKVKNDSTFRIIGNNQIYDTIKSQEQVLDQHKTKLVYDFLFDNLIDSKKYNYPDFLSNLSVNYNLILQSLKVIMVG